MALENCFHLTTVCSTRACVLQSCYSFTSKEKLYLPTCTGLQTSNLKFSLNSSSLTHSLSERCKKNRISCKAGEIVDEVQVVTEPTWNDLIMASGSPVLEEFWAPWCGPCRMIAPFIDELAKEYAGKIKCYKLNTDEWPNISTQYGIRSIPTVLFFKDGEKKESIIGAVPKATLSASVEKYV